MQTFKLAIVNDRVWVGSCRKVSGRYCKLPTTFPV